MGDECRKIILNTQGINENEVERSLVDFLHYIKDSSEENIPEGCDDRLRHLHEKITKIKSSVQMGVTYMKMQERDRLIKDEGQKIGTKRINELNRKLIADNRMEDLEKSVKDAAYQKILLEEYEL